MSTALWSSVIAVLGTLAGGLGTGLVQARLARTARRELRWDTQRSEALSAVTALAVALADHRRAMWVLEHHRLSGAEGAVVAEARAASHVTRSAVTAPLVQVSILLPTLADLARDAAQAAYALHDAPDEATLGELRVAAIHAVDWFVGAAARMLSAECGAVR